MAVAVFPFVSLNNTKGYFGPKFTQKEGEQQIFVFLAFTVKRLAIYFHNGENT